MDVVTCFLMFCFWVLFNFSAGRKIGGSTTNEERKANKVLREAEARNQQLQLLMKENDNTTDNLLGRYNAVSIYKICRLPIVNQIYKYYLE